MSAKTVYVFRHGQTDYNAAHRAMGQLDIPLNETGIAQAGKLADELATENIQAIYSSPLARAMQTARIVADKIGVKIVPNDGLMERNFGRLGGHIITITDNPDEYQMDLRRRKLCMPAELLNNPDWCPRGGESRNDHWRRAHRAIMDIVQNTPFDTIAISTHGGVISGILDTLDTAPQSMGNCTYIKLTFDGGKLQ